MYRLKHVDNLNQFGAINPFFFNQMIERLIDDVS